MSNGLIARRRQNRMFRSTLESLERRLCLSCEVHQEGSTLLIKGDDSDNHLLIEESGTTVAVTCLDNPAADAAPQNFEGITSITVRTGEGDDRVTHNVKGPDTRPASIFVDLGGGNDTLGVEASNLGRALWRYSVSAGAADDTVSLNLTEVFGGSFRVDLGAGSDMFSGSAAIGTPQEEPQPAAAASLLEHPKPVHPPIVLPARLSFEVFGGDDSDTLAFDGRSLTTPSNIRPREATLSLHLSGGGGDDAIAATLANVLLQGTTLLSIAGGEGSDSSRIAVNGGTVGKLTTRVDLGSGDDTSEISYNWATSTGRIDTFVNTGDGHDRSVLQTELKEARSDLNVHMNTAGGNDTSRVSFVPFVALGRLSVSVTTGDGNDSVLLSGGPAKARSRVAYSLGTGAGDDQLEIKTPAPSNLVSLRLNSGEGNDSLDVDLSPPPLFVHPELPTLATRISPFHTEPRPLPLPHMPAEASWISTASGGDKVDLDSSATAQGALLIVELGSGEDSLAAKFSTQPQPALAADGPVILSTASVNVLFSRLRLNVFAGPDHDSVSINGGVANTISGSDGNDRIHLSRSSSARISGGGGDDNISAEDGFAITIAGDIGNDTIAVTRASQARLSGADGNDSISISGGRENSASGGNHDDEVRIVDALGANSVELGSGNDVYSGQHNGAPGPTIALVEMPVTISVFGGTGNDTIRQTIGNPFTDDIGPVYLTGHANFKFDGGSGDDAASLTFAKSTIGGLTAALLGQEGNDALNFLAGGEATGTGSIDLHGQFAVDAHGGHGDDAINLSHAGVLRGTFKARITGDEFDPRMLLPVGGSADRISAIFRHAEGSEGTLLVTERGGVEDDVLTLIARAAEPTRIRSELLIDGGAGTDKATATKNVHVVNCEETVIVE